MTPPDAITLTEKELPMTNVEVNAVLCLWCLPDPTPFTSTVFKSTTLSYLCHTVGLLIHLGADNAPFKARSADDEVSFA